MAEYVQVTINGGNPELSDVGGCVQSAASYNDHFYYEAPWSMFPGCEYTEEWIEGEGYLLSAVPYHGMKTSRWTNLACYYALTQYTTPISADTETSTVTRIGPTETITDSGIRTRSSVASPILGYDAATVQGWHYTDDPDILPMWTGPMPEGQFSSPQDIGLKQKHTRVYQQLGSGLSGYEVMQEWVWTPISVNLQFNKVSITVRFYGRYVDSHNDTFIANGQTLTWDGPGALSSNPLIFGGVGLHNQVYGIDRTNYQRYNIAEVQGWTTNNNKILQEGVQHWLPRPGTSLANNLYTPVPNGNGDLYMDLHANYRNCTGSIVRNRLGRRMYAYQTGSGYRLIRDLYPLHGASS